MKAPRAGLIGTGAFNFFRGLKHTGGGRMNGNRTQFQRTGRWGAAAAVAAFAFTTCAASAFDDQPKPSGIAPAELIKTAVKDLIAMQEEDGDWPYQGVYRVAGQIPVGYRIGGTALVCEGLLAAAPDDKKADAAIERGVAFILKTLEHPLMVPSTRDTYDVRVWGHCYALDLFCRLRETKRMGTHAKAIEVWIPRLVAALIKEELPKGGWNYANRRAHAAFVTCPVTQALLLARAQSEDVPDEVFTRARAALEGSRMNSGTFIYSGRVPEDLKKDNGKDLPGSVARSAVSETTLQLLGGGSVKAVDAAISAFHEHWEWLEKRRKKTGTHVPPYGIAPYYFYYGHRYAAQAIQMLPAAQRQAEREKMLEKIMRTRDEDGTWNDRVFPRSRNFGTNMVMLALLGDKAPMPPTLAEAVKIKVRTDAPSLAWSDKNTTQPVEAAGGKPAQPVAQPEK